MPFLGGLTDMEDLGFTILQTVMFVRRDGFYPVEYPIGYDDWEVDARNNPGTIRIENAFGEVLWQNGEMN